MTASAIAIEFIAPLCYVLAPYDCKNEDNGATKMLSTKRHHVAVAAVGDFKPPKTTKSWRHYPAFVLFQLHFGLLCSMNLPQWQILAIISTVVFLPPHVWDLVESAAENIFFSVTVNTQTLSKGILSTKKIRHGDQMKNGKQQAAAPSRINMVVSRFFLYYMIFNFAGEHVNILLLDDGNIGEFFQFSQHWIMYGPNPSTTAVTALVTGCLVADNVGTGNDSPVAHNSTCAPAKERIDLFRAIRERNWNVHDGDDGVPIFVSEEAYQYRKFREMPSALTWEFPSFRWERAFHKFAGKYPGYRENNRMERLADALCHHGNSAILRQRPKSTDRSHGDERIISQVEISWRWLEIQPIDSKERFKRKGNVPSVEVQCP
mmetsp:Transcript_4742/g.6985  ORF Transcript_4742/g.6985 Transcript_4742/m.6985 type:complete len:375 (+) Transcript_4742:922-2046(+)